MYAVKKQVLESPGGTGEMAIESYKMLKTALLGGTLLLNF
jgi:hypothetical protein